MEGEIGRWVQVIGDGLRFQTDEARAIGVAIAVKALSRWLELRGPESVRAA